MASTTETIGRLIASEVLLRGERQLLRNNDPSHEQLSDDQPAQLSAAPISHNDKAVASVLLTLLDERLDASAKGAQGGLQDSVLQGDDPAARPNRIAAQYAEDDAVFRTDVSPQQSTVQVGPSANAQALLAATSPELRMAMQSVFMSAAARAQAEGTPERRGRDRKLIASPDILSLTRIGAGILVVGVLAALLISRLAS
jgi:hypothetical protein